MTHALRKVVPHSRRAVRATVAVVLVLLVALGAGLYWYFGPHMKGTKFAAMFTESIGIYPGSDVRVLGVPVGSVDSVTPVGTAVKISMTLDRGVSVLADTHAVIMSPSLVSDRYVQLTGVYPGRGAVLAGGTTIPLSRTATSVEIDDLNRSIVQLTQALGPNGANKHGALSELLKVGAANLGGNGAAIKQTIDQLGKASGTLSTSKTDLFRTIDNLANFTTTLQRNDRSVQGLNTSLASVSQVLANDRQSFTQALHDLSGALATVKGFIQRNQSLISSNVNKLSLITQTLVNERASLAQALRTAPLAVDNVINAYDPSRGIFVGRGNLNELSLWSSQTATTSSSTTSGSSSTSGPPMLLPSTGNTSVSGGS